MGKKTLSKNALALFREWGRQGGKMSKRTLTPEQAKKMVEARERKRRQKKKRKGK